MCVCVRERERERERDRETYFNNSKSGRSGAVFPLSFRYAAKIGAR